MDLLDSLFDEEPTRLMLDENQEKILSQYINLFEHGIPFAYIPNKVPLEKIFKEMGNCVENKSDDLLERLGRVVQQNRVY